MDSNSNDIFPPPREKEIDKLDRIVEVEQSELLKIKSCFPFDLLPTTVTVSRAKIAITFRPFFFTSETQNVLVSDIMTVIVEKTLLLSNLHIISRLVPESHIIVPNFSHTDASRFSEVVSGLMVVNETDVDLTKIDTKGLRSKLSAIGKPRSV